MRQFFEAAEKDPSMIRVSTGLVNKVHWSLYKDTFLLSVASARLASVLDSKGRYNPA